MSNEAKAARVGKLFGFALLWLAAASLLSSVGLALFFSRGIFRRISLLSANLDRLGQGQPLGPPVGGSDELTHLDDVLRDVSEQLTASRAATARGQRAARTAGRGTHRRPQHRQP